MCLLLLHMNFRLFSRSSAYLSRWRQIVDLSTTLFEVVKITGSLINMFVMGSTNSSGGCWNENSILWCSNNTILKILDKFGIVPFPIVPVFFHIGENFWPYDHLVLTHFNQVSYFGFKFSWGTKQAWKFGSTSH